MGQTNQVQHIHSTRLARAYLAANKTLPLQFSRALSQADHHLDRLIQAVLLPPSLPTTISTPNLHPFLPGTYPENPAWPQSNLQASPVPLYTVHFIGTQLLMANSFGRTTNHASIHPNMEIIHFYLQLSCFLIGSGKLLECSEKFAHQRVVCQYIHETHGLFFSLTHTHTHTYTHTHTHTHTHTTTPCICLHKQLSV